MNVVHPTEKGTEMARTAKAPLPNETRWNRCSADCGCPDVNHPDKRFCRKCNGTGCERDSKSRIQMREFALRVTENLTGPRVDNSIICPLTGMVTPIALCEVDKADPVLGYVFGNVVMVSRIGNQERSNLQKGHRDILGVERYISDVMVATPSAMSILPISVAMRMRDEVKGSELAKGESNGAHPYSVNVIEGPYGAY